jgi:hypothetical protein
MIPTAFLCLGMYNHIDRTIFYPEGTHCTRQSDRQLNSISMTNYGMVANVFEQRSLCTKNEYAISGVYAGVINRHASNQ